MRGTVAAGYCSEPKSGRELEDGAAAKLIALERGSIVSVVAQRDTLRPDRR